MVRVHDQEDDSVLIEDAGYLAPAGSKTIISMTHEQVKKPAQNTGNIREICF